MTSYYYELKRANKFIDDRIDEVIYRNGQEIKISSLTLVVTSKFEVGEKAILKRINLQVKARKDLRLVDDSLFSVGSD